MKLQVEFTVHVYVHDASADDKQNLAALTERVNQMPSLDDLKKAIQEAVTSEREQVNKALGDKDAETDKKVSALQVKVDDLQKKVDANQPITAADIDAVRSMIDSTYTPVAGTVGTTIPPANPIG